MNFKPKSCSCAGKKPARKRLSIDIEAHPEVNAMFTRAIKEHPSKTKLVLGILHDGLVARGYWRESDATNVAAIT